MIVSTYQTIERAMKGLEALMSDPHVRERPIEDVLKEYQSITQAPSSEVVEATFKNCNFDGADFLCEMNIHAENCSFKDANLHKSHISGKLKNCNFDVDWYKTWLGQYDELTMDNVDFGTKEIDPDYFFSENLTLKNPKINSQTLEGIKQTNPDCLKKDTFVPSRPANEM